MTIYICDDSKSDLLRLNHHLQEYLSHQDQKITIESFQSGEELLRRYEETMEKPSLIFLDIYMDDPDGMSVAHTLREEHYEGGLIFTTSSMEHAMDSYNVDALYYLQKPYDHEDFMNAIRRCTSIFEGTSKQYRINVQGKELQIPLRDILYFETVDGRVFAYTVECVYEIKGRLYQVEEKVNKRNICRASKMPIRASLRQTIPCWTT